MSNFTSYRVLMRIHLPPPNEGHLEAKEIVAFDGATLKRADGSVVKLPFSTAIDAAINAGWLVPLDSTTTEYVPQPAGIEVRAAQSTSEKREVVEVMTVQSEERNIGLHSAVRHDADHTKATERRATEDARSANLVSRGAPTGVKPTRLGLQQEDGSGRVVGRIKSAAISEPAEIGKTDHKLVSQLDNKRAVEVERVARVATGDVDEARTGDSLVDLLPNAASSDVPAGTFTNDGVQVVSTGSSVGGADAGVVVGSLKPSKSAAALEGALRKWATTGETWDGKSAQLPEISRMADSTLSALDAARAELEALKASNIALQTTVEVLQAASETPTEEGAVESKSVTPSSNFDWDLTRHWRTRQKDALQMYGDSVEGLQKVIAAEKSNAVKTALSTRITEIG